MLKKKCKECKKKLAITCCWRSEVTGEPVIYKSAIGDYGWIHYLCENPECKLGRGMYYQ